MRPRTVLVGVLAAVLSGCGSSSDDSATSPAAPATRVSAHTLAEIAAKQGPDIAIVPGTADHAPGDVRFSFLLLDREGRPFDRPRARVWIATGRDERPFSRATARSERVGVPGGYENDADVTKLYVATLRVPRAGNYWVLAEPVGGRPVQALGNLVVKKESASPEVGAKAYPSRTPTIGDAPLDQLTTRIPPDRELLRHSVVDSLRDRKPFVVTFSTPKFCASRTCGPVVDVVDRVRGSFAETDVRFIHVEIYESNDPALGVNEWVKEWRLPSEPWTFLVGRDGRIAAKFEGSVSVRELQAAVRRHLLRR